MVDNEQSYHGLPKLSEEDLSKLLHSEREQRELARILLDDDFKSLKLLVALREIQPATVSQLSGFLSWNVNRVTSGIVNLGGFFMVDLQKGMISSSGKGSSILSDVERAFGIDFRPKS